MKSSVIFCFVFVISLTSSQRCKRATQLCISGGFGVFYNDCTQLCCGGTVQDREPNLECCAGVIYNTQTDICCKWENQGTLYPRNNQTENQVCCGNSLYDPVANPGLSCCNSDTNLPQTFNTLTEMCCEGVVNFAGNTAYTQCCGSTPFDRRVASCPCSDNLIYLVPFNNAMCCVGAGGSVQAYDITTQACCNGVAYDLATQFCCGGLSIGNSSSQICCSSAVVSIAATNTSQNNIACCERAPGFYTAYNVQTQTCCGGRVLTLDPTISQVCCGSVLYNRALSGTQCCGNAPFFPQNNICCGGVASPGDRCCNGIPYFSANQTCCDGTIYFSTANQICCGGTIHVSTANQFCCAGTVYNNFTAIVPACCIGTPFDSYFQTCCGPNLFGNPTVTQPDGSTSTSHNTRCCGMFDDPTSLRPYDYFTQTCCDGSIVDLPSLVSPLSAVCCGQGVVDLNGQLCCNDQTAANPYGSGGRCCGNQVISMAESVCCNGVPGNRSTEVCCGDTFANRSTQICCNNVPTELNGIAPNAAACCAGIVYDSSAAFCCAGSVTSLGVIPLANAVCCGASVIDSTQVTCCGGVAQSRLAAPGEICCGTTLMDPTAEKCCENVPRSLNGIAPDKAICCGDGCIDADLFWCCEGKQYSRGAVAGVTLSDLTCSAVLPTN